MGGGWREGGGGLYKHTFCAGNEYTQKKNNLRHFFYNAWLLYFFALVHEEKLFTF